MSAETTEISQRDFEKSFQEMKKVVQGKTAYQLQFQVERL